MPTSPRPYRLTVDVDSDVADLRRLIEAGNLRAAIEMFGRGGVLANSLAPGVMALFDELREDLRSAVLRSGDPSALDSWTVTLGREDADAWRRLAAVLPTGHPRRAAAAGRIRLIDQRYGR